MNSESFINSYLKKHHYETPQVRKIKILKFILICFIVTSLVFIFQPLTLIKESALGNLKNVKGISSIKISDYSNTAKNTHNKYSLPIDGKITSDYGMRQDPFTNEYKKHTGIDIAGEHRASVRTIENGTVVFAGSQVGYGYSVLIKHVQSNETFYTFYAHLSSILVTTNQFVTAREIIGKEGGDPKTDPNPGYSTGHHLHFEIRTGADENTNIDPKRKLAL